MIDSIHFRLARQEDLYGINSFLALLPFGAYKALAVTPISDGVLDICIVYDKFPAPTCVEVHPPASTQIPYEYFPTSIVGLFDSKLAKTGHYITDLIASELVAEGNDYLLNLTWNAPTGAGVIAASGAIVGRNGKSYTAFGAGWHATGVGIPDPGKVPNQVKEGRLKLGRFTIDKGADAVNVESVFAYNFEIEIQDIVEFKAVKRDTVTDYIVLYLIDVPPSIKNITPGHGALAITGELEEIFCVFDRDTAEEGDIYVDDELCTSLWKDSRSLVADIPTKGKQVGTHLITIHGISAKRGALRKSPIISTYSIIPLELGGGGGGEPGVSDHGELEGLTDDDHPQYQRHPNGVDVGAQFTVSYDPSTRQFSLTIEAGGGSYWSNGTKYTLPAGAVITPAAHADTTGTYWLYYHEDTLTVGTPTFITDCPLAYVFFATDGTDRAVLFDERHPATWDPSVWRYVHQTQGSQLISGGTLADYTLDSNTLTHNQPSISQTVFDDESYRHTLEQLPATGPYTIWYRTGASTNNSWNWDITSVVPWLDDGDDPYYNQLSVGTWFTTAITNNNRWVNYWLCATNAYNDLGDGYKHRYVFIMGQAVYSTLASARLESFLESISWGTLPFVELVPLYKITLRRVSNPSNRNIQIEEVSRIVGTNVTSITTIAPTIHSTLSGRTEDDQHPATSVSADTTNFNGLLSATEDDVQLALEKLDEIGHGLTITGDIVVTDEATVGTLIIPGATSGDHLIHDGTSFVPTPWSSPGTGGPVRHQFEWGMAGLVETGYVLNDRINKLGNSLTLIDCYAQFKVAPTSMTIIEILQSTMDDYETGEVFTSILSTKLTVDADGKTSDNATTPYSFAVTSIDEDTVLRCGILSGGDAGEGLTVVLVVEEET